MLWIISSLVFILLRVAPGDPVDAILGSGANDFSREFLRNKLGLNESLIMNNLVVYLNFYSLINSRSLNEIIPAPLKIGFDILF